ncbi:hypothetical protein V2I01_33430 [Micromonospora sp. BRA006-A]|nr:hypothetical protein [Micromonospora sp. BRA006-A]
MTDDDLGELRRQVRKLVGEWRDGDRFRPVCDAWLRSYDTEFSRAGRPGLDRPDLAARVRRAGPLEPARLVVTEELLRAGAPVAAHWIADRQIGPAVLRYGPPRCANGTCRRSPPGR